MLAPPGFFFFHLHLKNSNIQIFEFTLPHDYIRVNGHRLVDEGYQRVVLATGV